MFWNVPRGTGRVLRPVADRPQPPCRTLRYVSNRFLRVLVLKGLLPCALHQVALVSFHLPTYGDSRPELHAPHNNDTSGMRERTAASAQSGVIAPL